jgi:hypothetical protein
LLFFALNFSLRFDLVIFASKRNEGENFFALKEAKFNIFCIILLPNFVSGAKKPFLSIFSLHSRLFYLRFCFRFLVFRIEVNHVKSGFFSASKRNEIFASISNFAFEAKMRAHPMTECQSQLGFSYFIEFLGLSAEPGWVWDVRGVWRTDHPLPHQPCLCLQTVLHYLRSGKLQ